MAQQAADEQAPLGEEPTELRRVMGPKLLLLFIVGDILGTGVYALTGQVAEQVGGAAWAPFILAFAIALVTAFSYLELVTKYPRAAGAALYTHKAFGVHLLTFMVCFTVMCSGITSASTASRAFASNLAVGFGLDETNATLIITVALIFMAVVASVNLRGVSESVRANIFLTLVELSGLLLVILVGFYAVFAGRTDFSRTIIFEDASDRGVFFAVTAATSLAFFAMVGFEDSVNMAEETHDPVRNFPKMMITGIGITGVIYVLVAIFTVAIVPVGELGESETPLTLVVQRALPDFPMGSIYPFITIFAVANSALINMLMASRLLYGMAKQKVLPPFLGKVAPSRRTPWAAILFTTVLAFGLIVLVTLQEESGVIAALGGTTSLLLLAVFTIVNVAVLKLRNNIVERKHFVAPTILPIVGALLCAFFVGPWTGRDPLQYQIAGWLLLIGVILWFITWAFNRPEPTQITDPDALSEREGGVN